MGGTEALPPAASPSGPEATDNDLGEKGPVALGRLEPLLQELEQPAGTNCLIFGPSDAGKTTLLCAIGEMPQSPTGGGAQVTAILEQTDVARELQYNWYQVLLGEKPPIGSNDNRLYFWNVTVKLPGWWRPTRVPMRIAFHDGPGGALFPARARRADGFAEEGPGLFNAYRKELIEAGHGAETLVLVLQVPKEGRLGDRQLLTDINGALSALTQTTHTLRPSWPRRMLDLIQRKERFEPNARTIGGRPVEVRRTLACKRFLLLINKVDSLCVDVAAAANVRPDVVAANLDPVGVCCSLFKEGLLRRILNVAPEAKVAVGLMSATGFDSETGEPIMDASGGRSGQTRDAAALDLLPRIRPFGIREALVFMVTGQCTGPVREVPRALIAHDIYRWQESLDLPEICLALENLPPPNV